MSTLWSSGTRQEDVDSSIEGMLEKCKYLEQEDKDFILASFNAGKYGYVLEYIFNKSMKVLEDVVFTIGEEVVVGICHWVDKNILIKFFDIFVLRLASQLELMTKDERVKLVYINEILQNRKETAGSENAIELSKKDVEKYIRECFDIVLLKNYDDFTESFNKLITTLREEEILPFSDKYADIINAPKHEINFLLRLMFVLLKSVKKEDEKKNTSLIVNVKNLFPLLWENIGLNDKKFFAYYIKVAPEDSLLTTVMEEISGQIKMQDFSMDIAVATKLLKTSQEIISAHFSINNHKSEASSLLSLQEYNQIPKLFLRNYITPCVITYLGNSFGYINESHMIAAEILENISDDKWQYYFENFFEKDDFVLITLLIAERCLKDWCVLIKGLDIDEDDVQNENVKVLLKATKKNDYEGVVDCAKRIFYDI